MISVNDLKTGLTLELDNGLWSVVEFLHVKPGKGAAFVRTKLKNVESGNVIERTFRAGEKVGKATLDRREMQYLYKEGKEFIMMDMETYEQLSVSDVQVGDGDFDRDIHTRDKGFVDGALDLDALNGVGG